jgi:hypothetical protein
MDESAEWRMQYDKEFEKNRQLQDELSKVLLDICMQLCSSDTPTVLIWEFSLQVKATLAGTARRLELLQKVEFF